MIASDLAHAIADEVMTPKSKVLDPFCGAGRTLLAGAHRGVKAVGVDVNPLALLIAEAKVSRVDPGRLRHLIQSAHAPKRVPARRLYIDRFIADQMQLYGFELHSIEVRRLSSKTSPSSVNAMARSGTDRAVATMREEFVVHLHR